MKATLKLAPHSRHPGDCVEVWFDGEMVAVIYGADGPGVRIMSKYIHEQTTEVEMQSRGRDSAGAWSLPGMVEVKLSLLEAMRL